MTMSALLRYLLINSKVVMQCCITPITVSTLRKTNVLCLSAVEDPLFHLIWDFCTGPFLVSTASEQIWGKKNRNKTKKIIITLMNKKICNVVWESAKQSIAVYSSQNVWWGMPTGVSLGK